MLNVLLIFIKFYILFFICDVGVICFMLFNFGGYIEYLVLVVCSLSKVVYGGFLEILVVGVLLV